MKNKKSSKWLFYLKNNPELQAIIYGTALNVVGIAPLLASVISASKPASSAGLIVSGVLVLNGTFLTYLGSKRGIDK